MFEFLSTVPHCAMWGKPWLVSLHLVGDLLTGTAYIALPIAIEIVRWRRGFPLNLMAICFAVFILSCGLGHFLDIVTMLSGEAWTYWWAGWNDLVTGIVSWATAVYAFRLIPVLVAIPDWETHESMKRTLGIIRETEFWNDLRVNQEPT